MYDNTVSARTYLSYIAEQAGGRAVIGRDGKLYIKTIGESSVTLPLKLFKTFKWGEKFKITRVRYDDGIQLFEKGDTTGNTVYISQDNMYIVDQDQINNIYNALKGLEFYSFEGESIIDPALDTGDIVVIDGKNVIYQGSMQFSGRWIANIESKIQCKAKEETTTRTLSQKTINRRVKSNINQIDGKITQLTEETTENTQKITKVEQDVNGITSKVSSVEQSVENITKIEGTAEGKNIYIDDASAEPLIDIMLEGESQQATRSGKNKFNINAVTSTSTLTNNGDGTLTTTTLYNQLSQTLKELAPDLKVGDSVKIVFKTNGENYIYLVTSKVLWSNGKARTITEDDLNGVIAFYGKNTTGTTYTISDVMILNATETDLNYEQYGASPSPDYISKIENLEGKNKVKEINWKQVPSITTGVTVTNINGYGTDHINVNNTKQYIFSYLGTSGSRYIVYYDKDKNFLGYDTKIQINNFAKWNETRYVRLRIDCPQGSVTAFQLEEGTVATGYVPYNSLEIKDVGKNLYAGNEITINGTYSSNTSVNLGSRYLSEGTYTISLTNSLPNNSYIYLGANGSIVTAIRNKATFTLTEEQNVPMRLVVKAGTYSNFTTKIMIEKGMVVTDYEPHQQQTEYFPLSEGQKLYKNSYLADDGIHHSRKQVVLDGTETGWYTLANQTGTNTSYFCIPKSDMKKASTLICDKFINRNVWNTDEEGIQSIIDNFIRLRINTSRASTVAELKTWLSNNPIRVEYELAEKEIVPYTEDQKEAWEKLRHFTLFRGINNITSTANAKITYVRDNGLSDTYETKRNVKENHYTKSETDSQISQTADSIKESVKEINEQTQEKLATLELANQSLEFTTKRVGGNNLIRNSAMINDNNFWLAHAKYPYQESDTPPDSPTEGAYWYCTANSGSYIENQMYVYNSGWQVSELSRKSLLSAQNYFAYTTSNEYWANGKNANENTLSGRVIKLDGRQDYTVSHIFNITEPITLNQNENKMAISHFIKNSIVQGNVCVGLMFLNEADFTEVEKPYSLYEPGIILTPDDLKDLTKIEQIIEIPKKSDFIPVVVSNTAPTDTTKNWLDATIYLPKKYNSQTSQWEILDTKMSLYNESSREVWTYRYFYGFYYQTPIIYDTAEIKSCYVALTFYPAFAVYTGNVEPTPYKGLYWNNKTTNLVKRAKYDGTTFVEWETLDIPSSLLPTGASLGVELFDYIVPIKGFVEIADLKLEYNTMCTQWTQFPGEVYGKNYKMDEKGFWIQANQNTMFIDEDEILATYKGINIFQINKDLAYFYKIQATESIEVGNYFLKTQQINSKNMLLLY